MIKMSKKELTEEEEIKIARKLAEEGFKAIDEGNLEDGCPKLTKALGIFLKYHDGEGKFKYPQETAKILCSLPYGCVVRASKGRCK